MSILRITLGLSKASAPKERQTIFGELFMSISGAFFAREYGLHIDHINNENVFIAQVPVRDSPAGYLDVIYETGNVSNIIWLNDYKGKQRTSSQLKYMLGIFFYNFEYVYVYICVCVCMPPVAKLRLFYI